jgi:hypothetical protein
MKDKVIGFEALEDIGVGLVNVLKCQSCEKIINYNGFPPRVCPHCNQVVDKSYLQNSRSRYTRQLIVSEWLLKTFGEDSLSRFNRALRFLEEAIELVQAEGLLVEEAQKLLEYVYSRPLGSPPQEAGGVGLALLAYCESIGYSADHLETDEIERVLALDPDHFRKRQAEKIAAGVAPETPKE